MERASGVVVLAGDFGWSDIGSWKAVADEFEHDARRAIRPAATSCSPTAPMCTSRRRDRLVAAVGG